AAAEQKAGDVDMEGAVPDIDGHGGGVGVLVHYRRIGEGGIVEQDVDLAKAADGLVHHGLEGLLVADIELDRHDPVSELLRQALDAGQVEVGGHHGGALVDKPFDRRGAYAATRAGNDGDFVFESFHETNLYRSVGL